MASCNTFLLQYHTNTYGILLIRFPLIGFAFYHANGYAGSIAGLFAVYEAVDINTLENTS